MTSSVMSVFIISFKKDTATWSYVCTPSSASPSILSWLLQPSQSQKWFEGEEVGESERIQYPQGGEGN